MICPKCKEDCMRPDHDWTYGVESYACWKCGYRIYPLYPARMATPEDQYRSGDGVKLNFCSRCGKEHYNPRGRYCDECLLLKKSNAARKKGRYRNRCR